MALQKDLEVPTLGEGFIIPGAYISVAMVRVTPHVDREGDKTWRMLAEVKVHVSRAAKDSNASSIFSEVFKGEFPADQAVNPLTWLYNELKNDPKYSGAIDV